MILNGIRAVAAFKISALVKTIGGLTSVANSLAQINTIAIILISTY
jgi:hypothetical protein